MESINIENETWLNIVGYEEWYQISNTGRVKNKDRTATSKAILS